MSKASRRLLSAVLYAAPIAGAALFPAMAKASNQGMAGPESFTLSPSAQQQSAEADAAAPGSQDAEQGNIAPQDRAPLFLDEAPAEEKPNIHGFFESPFKTSYVTPRGLVVFDKGVVWQPVAGLVLPTGDMGPVKNTAVVAGIWNSAAFSQGDPRVGAWQEMDVFVSFGGDIGPVNTTITYGAWNFPGSTLNKPRTEHNIDVKIVYSDAAMWGKESGFSINPYADVFFAVSGSSTVVLGRQGSTGYVEIGVTPTYTLKAIPNYPITFKAPTYISVGPASYWGAGESGGVHDGNFGVFCAGLNGSIPLSFIPAKYGFWHADAGVTYFYLKNNNILNAGTILSGNTDRNFVQGSVGIGVNF